MEKKQSMLKRLDNPYVFISLTLLIVIVAFIIFSPRASSILFPFKRVAAFNSFLSETKSNNQIDPRKFWEFREFYSPGYFKFSNNGISQYEVQTSLKDFGLDPKNVTLYFSKFNSKNLESLDGLASSSSLNDLINQNNLKINKILFKNENTIIFESKDNKTFIIFTLPVSKMSKVNGFFDYNGVDKKILNGKTWIDITKISG